MNIVKPRKNNNLIKTEQVLEEIKEEELVNRQIENTTLEEIEIYDVKFETLKMINIEKTNGK